MTDRRFAVIWLTDPFDLALTALASGGLPTTARSIRLN
jgi:hypothetical protein